MICYRIEKAMVVLVASSFCAFGQGSLTPPGAPDIAMKTLDQLEPRTPISSLPYTITERGSYYLTTNLTTETDGIIVQASDVILDFMGFTIEGDYGDSDNGLDFTTFDASRVRVHNGKIRRFGVGVYGQNVTDSFFDRLDVSTNKFYGVFLSGISGACDRNTVSDSILILNGIYGVLLSTGAGQCKDNVVKNSLIAQNDDGIGFDSVGGGDCTGNEIRDCRIVDNGNVGIQMSNVSGICSDNSIVRCAVNGNGAFGISIGATLGDSVCSGNIIEDCHVNHNSAAGIYITSNTNTLSGNIVRNCTLRGNEEVGIRLYEGRNNRVEHNYCGEQTLAMVETIGIHSQASYGNYILGNTCVGNTNNYLLSTNDVYGPIVTAVGELSSTGGAAHAWANFSR